MERRAFLKRGLGLSTWMLAAGGLSLPVSGCFGARRDSSSTVPRRRLPIPELLEFHNEGAVELTMQAGECELVQGLKTPTWGFNGSYLGPTVRLRRGQDVPFLYRNELTEPIAVHGHGLHVPGDVDGGPQQLIAPGESWAPTLPIRQQACTSWYHPHTHGRTGLQVNNGLAGFLLIDDDNSDELPLPKSYGVDDLPLVVQDRTLDRQGSFVYSLEDADEEDGFLGETVTVNGVADPVAEVPAGLVRLRILNGSNARFYRFHFQDGRTFHKIATDGGFLEGPVPLTEMIMTPGERNEIVVDFSDGQPAILVSGPGESGGDRRDRDERGERGRRDDGERGERRGRDRGDERRAERGGDGGRRRGGGRRGLYGGGLRDSFQILELRVNPEPAAFRGPLPATMNTIVRPSAFSDTPDRTFVLNMPDGRRGRDRAPAESSHGHDMGHMSMRMGINGQAMDMSRIDERVRLGQWERWRVENEDGHHPFHVHGCSFLVLSQEGQPVRPENAGWKDTVLVSGSAEFIVRFDHEATEKHPYMVHCHILEHEDMGMMGQFTVTKS